MDRTDSALPPDPLVERYATPAMTAVFSARRRYGLWRRLWLALLETEKELGLPVTSAQVESVRARLDDVDLAAAAVKEKELRHDVMAHIHVLREQCPDAGPVIHLGATSCFVTDNADLIQMREGLRLLAGRLRGVIAPLAEFCRRNADLPTVGFTHLQPAQFTTVGKRAALWLQDLLMDHEDIDRMARSLRFRGAKGATGTQDSFMKLFGGDGERVRELDRRVAARMGFESVFTVTGQTYTRKLDCRILGAVAGIGASAHKMTNDIRMLQHLGEIEEPFESSQVGSSAMAYKRNPMLSERTASLSRYLQAVAGAAEATASTQFLERTLDDSAVRRLTIPAAFLAADAILNVLCRIVRGLEVREGVIRRHLAEQMPYIASEEILMEAVRRGGDRQALHEVLRRHSMAAAEGVKNGGTNDFLRRLAEDPAFAAVLPSMADRLRPERFVGRAGDQVREFLAAEVEPVLASGDVPAEDALRV